MAVMKTVAVAKKSAVKSSVLRPSYLQAFDLAKAFNFKMTPSSEELVKVVNDLREVLGSALIIGGVAVGHYGFERTTTDVDILYKNRDVKILQRLGKHFDIVVNAESGWNEMKHRSMGIRLELIPEGGLGQYGFIPFCDTVGGQDGFISLSGLIWLKLVAGRRKDDMDVIELYKCDPKKVSAARSSLPVELHERYDKLASSAQNELDNDPYLHPEKYMIMKLENGTIVDLSKKSNDSSGSSVASEAPAPYPAAAKKSKRKTVKNKR